MKIELCNYRSTFTPEDLGELGKHFTIKNIEMCEAQTHNNGSVLLWNNNYPFSERYLAQFPFLKLFLNWGTSDHNLPPLSVFSKRGITVKLIDSYATESVAEFAVLQLLASTRCIVDLVHHDKPIGSELYGKKIGIIVMGKIGFRIAQILHQSFHCRICYFSRTEKSIKDFSFVSIDTLLRESDFVIMAVKSQSFALTDKQLTPCNKRLVLINIGRDEAAPFPLVREHLCSGDLRSFYSDTVSADAKNAQKTQSYLSGHIAYKTQEALLSKKALLRLMLKKYFLFTMKTQTSIFFIRHGKTIWNEKGTYQGTLNSSLSEIGRAQALRIAEFLSSRKISHIYVSPLGRAQETAGILREKLQCTIEVVDDFHEMDFGVFQGKQQEEIKELFADFFEERKHAKLHTPFPGGESYYDVYLRVLHKALAIAAEHRGNIAIVGHESVNRIIRGIIEERPLEEAVQLRQKNNEVIEYRFDEDREIVHEI
jgi:broad specificity phosphatase PhoE/lactate dehydrogenase-like 2-hydroxyacid dehydrogenase